jgi:hypothetical protein
VLLRVHAAWGVALTGLNPGSRLPYYAVFTGTMAVNCATEYLFQRFVVYRGSINTNGLAIKTPRGEET